MIIFPYYQNLADLSTTTITSGGGGTVPTGMEATNLADPDLSLVWRNTDIAANRYVDLDFGAAATVRAVAIVGSNVSSGATGHKVQLSANSGHSPVGIESAYSDPHGAAIQVATGWPYLKVWVHVFGANQSYRYCRLHHTDTSNPDSYLQWRRVLIGGALIDPGGGVNLTAGHSYGLEDSSTVVQMRSGLDRQLEGVKRRRQSLSIDRLTRAEAHQDLDFWARKGLGSDLYVAPDESDADMYWYEGLYCRQESMPQGPVHWTDSPARQFWRTQLSLIERNIMTG